MKAIQTRNRFFDPTQYLPRMPQSVDDLKVHNKNDYNQRAIFENQASHNVAYLFNPKRANRHIESQFSIRILYDAGIQVIKQNPDLLKNYNSFPHSISGKARYGITQCNEDKALFVIFLGLEASKKSVGIEQIKDSFMNIYQQQLSHTLTPFNKIDLPNGEVLNSDSIYYQLMAAFLENNQVSVEKVYFNPSIKNIHGHVQSIVERDLIRFENQKMITPP